MTAFHTPVRWNTPTVTSLPDRREETLASVGPVKEEIATPLGRLVTCDVLGVSSDGANLYFRPAAALFRVLSGTQGRELQ